MFDERGLRTRQRAVSLQSGDIHTLHVVVPEWALAKLYYENGERTRKLPRCTLPSESCPYGLSLHSSSNET